MPHESKHDTVIEIDSCREKFGSPEYGKSPTEAKFIMQYLIKNTFRFLTHQNGNWDLRF